MLKKVCFFAWAMMSLLVHNQVLATDYMNGVWKHSAKPVLLMLDLESGLLSVQSHGSNAKANGLTVIKNIKPNPKVTQYWTGDMYNGYLDKYVKVNLSLENNLTLLVSDTANTEVLKLERE